MVVSHQGSEYLPRTLQALTGQSRAADLIWGVDAASTDGSARVLETALGADQVTVLRAQRQQGFGQSVKAGLAAAARSGHAAPQGAQEWVWLLHDDAAPAPDALERLLAAVERSANVTIAGCKQLDWDAPRMLVDAGLAISPRAERLTLIEPDEMDQGQYDGLRDRFAVNSAGMLIRRDVWDAFDGFDPALTGTGDDVDLCWRNWLAGNNVLFVPQARVFHVADRPHGLGRPMAARTAQVYTRLKHAAGPMVPVLTIGMLLGAVLRLFAAVAMKDPGYGIQQLAGTVRGVSRPLTLLKGRRQAARTRKNPRSSITRLQTPLREVKAHRRSLMEAIGADALFDDTSVAGSLPAEPSGDGQDDFSALAAPSRIFAGTGLIAAMLITLGVSFAGLISLVGAPATGGALLPLSSSLGQIWENANRSWITLEAGFPGQSDPFGFVLWAVAFLNAGQTQIALQSALIAAMPLAAAGAWFLAASLTRHRRIWFLAALLWGLAPALFFAVDQGRLGAVVAHVLLPWFVLALARATGSARDRRRELSRGDVLPLTPGQPRKSGTAGTVSWAAGASAGLVLAAIGASAPSIFAPAVVMTVLLALVFGPRGRTLWWALAPSAALFVPFIVAALNNPRALLADPGLQLESSAAPLWQQLLGQPVLVNSSAAVNGFTWLPAGVPTAWILLALLAVPVTLLAFFGALVPGWRGRGATLGLLGAVVAAAAAWATAWIVTGSNDHATVTPFSGPGVSAMTLGIMVAGIFGADRLLQRRKASAGRHRPWRVAMAAVVALLVLAGPLLGAFVWIRGNHVPLADGQESYGPQLLVQPQALDPLPATAMDRGLSDERTRSLVITDLGDGSFRGVLVRGAGTTLDSLSTLVTARSIAAGGDALSEDDDASAQVRKAVATIVAGRGVDPREGLEELGAGFVVLRPASDADQSTAARIDAVPGLVAVGQTTSGWLWRSDPLDQPPLKKSDTINRLRILEENGTVQAQLDAGPVDADTDIPAGKAGRLLVLAERSDPSWRASLNGKELTSTTAGWRQAFELPQQGGHLTLTQHNPWTPWWPIVQAVVFIFTVLLAIPIPERPGKVRMVRDEASLREARRG